MSEEKKGVVLSLADVILLNEELKHMNKEKEISFVLKYKLSKLLEKTEQSVKNFNDKKLSLFKKYGKEVKGSPGTFSLKGGTKANEKKGLEELEGLITIEETFTEQYPLNDFSNLKSEVGYNVIYRFLVE